MPKIRVNDINAYYEIKGQGKPVVLVNGFGADHKTWGVFADKLAQKFKVILYDNRGAGKTDCPDESYSIKQLAADVKVLCENLDIAKASFIGGSMGGFIVQQIAHDYPELCEKMVILNSGAKLPKHYSLFMQSFYAVMNSCPSLGAETRVKLLLPWLYSDSFLSDSTNVDQLVQKVVNHPNPFSLVGYKNQRAASESFDSTQWISKVKTSTLIVGSKKDVIFYESTIKDLFERMPNAKYYRFKKVGHLPYIERPSKLAKLIYNFLS